VSDKRAARARARERLRGLPATEQAAKGAAIAAGVWRLPELVAARTILLFASVPGEPPTDPIAAEARLRGIEIVYPRCIPGFALSLHAVGSAEELRVGSSFGVREPLPHCPPIGVGEIDIAFLPGLAWDRSGTRLGRGAGYYDRLLATDGFGAVRCGLFFAAQELPDLPRDPWDVPLDVVVTEEEVVRFG
jgi:5-formyltetrahydrofolate cyclo-ligase